MMPDSMATIIVTARMGTEMTPLMTGVQNKALIRSTGQAMIA
jgi:hypothetical protein